MKKSPMVVLLKIWWLRVSLWPASVYGDSRWFFGLSLLSPSDYVDGGGAQMMVDGGGGGRDGGGDGGRDND